MATRRAAERVVPGGTQPGHGAVPRARTADTTSPVIAVAHTVVYRPWGSYEITDHGPRFRVKRLVVNPGHKLSLQMHHHRAEHWAIVQGTAKVERKRLDVPPFVA